ncbi:Crp/Fnr family transcriptional regulator [Aurantibacillus circumpalustris]|uniref:Crp/Fnr family transcriptional regulator n=1 Tax=Aurantibacillus circumpalustris TaxID=3036359 RepID=UPI00295AB96D|nr:Crp/Fnr family transcriptional regulator [Aurantibacillus circumpalustris]
MTPIIKSKIEDNLNYFHFYSGMSVDNIPVQEKSELLNNAALIRLKKKSILYAEGEIPKGVYVIKSGKVKVSQLNVNGAVQIFFIYSSGDLFGHRPILCDGKHPVTAVALEDSELLFIEKDHFQNVLRNSNQLSTIFLQSVSHEFTVLVNRINIFAQRSIKERLAYFLLVLNDKYKLPEQSNEQAEIKVNRSDLASCTGTSLENLVRTLRDFKDQNFIRTDGKSIYITDFEALYSLTRV